jgi:probable tRNA-dihydrouridine synthase
MSNFYQSLPRPFISLAPMEDVTDVVFRQVVARAGRPDLFYTEFTNTDSFVSPLGKHSALRRLQFLPSEQPIVAQIWGSKPESFANTIPELKAMGYQAVDINMGCPDKAVVKSGGGSALIRNPELAGEIIRVAKQAGLPLSVKTRLGFSRVDEWRDWLSFLLQQDLELLTVHLRTRKEMSRVEAHFELIPAIIALRDQIAPQTRLAINGDVLNRTQALELAHQYNLDGVMIGRGVFQNPFCFTDKIPTQNELLDLLKLHLDLFDKHNTDGAKKFAPLKKFFKIYLRDFDGAKDLRARLMLTDSTAEVRQILADFEAGRLARLSAEQINQLLED